MGKEAEEICKGVSGPLHDLSVDLADNILFLSMKLSETREKAECVDLVIPYDNGGGQSGFRKNPIFEAYNSMFAQYTKGMSLLQAVLKDAPQTSVSKSKLVALSKSVDKLRQA